MTEDEMLTEQERHMIEAVRLKVLAAMASVPVAEAMTGVSEAVGDYLLVHTRDVAHFMEAMQLYAEQLPTVANLALVKREKETSDG